MNKWIDSWVKKEDIKECDNNLNEEKLDEAPTAAEKFEQVEPETPHGETITEVLDRCSEEAKEFYASLASMKSKNKTPAGAKQTNKYNPLFVGPTGAGKTSIISTWAADHGYKIVTLNMMGDALDFLGVKTINRDYDLPIDDEGHTKKVARVSTVATQAFDQFLTGPKKVLFLDEINKANPAILQALYDLISFHTVQNGDEVMELPKLLFTVGAMNPSEYGNREPLDPALKARMQIYHVNYDTEGLKDYLIKTLTEFVEDDEDNLKEFEKGEKEEIAGLTADEWKKKYEKDFGRLELTKAIFAEPSKFHWTDAASIADADELEPVLVPRTLEAAIFNSNGTKADLLVKVKRICGIQGLDVINNILSNYRDKDHKANLIWGKDYSVKEEPENKDLENAEDSVLADMSDEEKEESKLKDNLLTKAKNWSRNNSSN